jgi:hypothetical protein
MKKILIIFTLLAQLFIITPLFSAVYEASTLHNSVSRSETVQDLYVKRWKILQEENFYFDIYGKINWVFGFNINTINAGTDESETTDLRLTRTYGSMTLAMPIGGHRPTPDDNDLIIAFTTTGFHYGLTKDIKIDRGPAGTESISDYKHSQFFDDIYAFSILYRPYLTLHAGLIFNNEYIPEDDGTMDYFNPVESYSKKFFAVEVYGCTAFSMNIDNGKPESIKAELEVTKIIGLFKDLSNPYIPAATLGYERTMAYNDEEYDAVWVNKIKLPLDDLKENANLHIFSLKLIQRISKNFTLEGFYAGQYITEDIYTKTDQKKIDPSVTKEWYMLINIDPIPASPEDVKYKAYTGMSWYWDPAIAIHRKTHSKGNGAYGWILGGEIDFKNYGADFKTEYNFSTELKKLIETSDKLAVEGSIFLRI